MDIANRLNETLQGFESNMETITDSIMRLSAASDEQYEAMKAAAEAEKEREKRKAVKRKKIPRGH